MTSRSVRERGAISSVDNNDSEVATFNFTSTASGEITIRWTGDQVGGTSVINLLQISEVPEPSTLLLFCFSSLILLRRRRQS